MKKIVLIMALVMSLSAQAKAESIVVIDSEGRVVRQMFTAPSTFDTPVATNVQTTTVANTTAPVVATTPQVMVVRESPVVQNSYYYDRGTTNALVAAGVTSAVVGGVIYHGFRPHHHRPSRLLGKPHHGHRR